MQRPPDRELEDEIATTVGRAIWEVGLLPAFADRVGGSLGAWERGPDAFIGAARRASPRLASELSAWMPGASSEFTQAFRGPELRQVAKAIVMHILGRPDGADLVGIRAFFVNLTLHLCPVSRAESSDLPAIFEMYVDVCEQALWGRASQQSETLALLSKARSKQREEVALAARWAGEQVAKQRDLGWVADTAESISQAAQNVHGKITPPSFEGAPPVDIDRLYEPPSFMMQQIDVTTGRQYQHPMEYEDLAARATRVVVLGDPGAGKSTFAQRLSFRLASGERAAPAPMVVVLREYDAAWQQSRLSLTRFMVELAERSYGTTVSEAQIKLLCSLGRLTVVFDGLDELRDLTRRRKIGVEVQTFAARFPACAVVVTSRVIGYEHAPLDTTRFNVVRLSHFSESQVRSYAGRWFGWIWGEGGPEAVIQTGGADVEARVNGFMKESDSIPDLRSNGLMLALLCRLYRGEGSLPRNRPDVYDKCSRMLFETWDRQRGVELVLPIEDRLGAVIQHLARWIYEEPELQQGVTEPELVFKTSEYLNIELIESRQESEAAAQALIDFCRGRAWVFTDLGTTEGDQPLFAFTHRTFLEFFAAKHLVGGCDSSDDLLDLLVPHLEVGEWEVVAQLSFQLMHTGRRGKADELLTLLVIRSRQYHGERGALLLAFALRVLNGLAPKPSTTRAVVRAGLDGVFDERYASTRTKTLGVEAVIVALASVLNEVRAPAFDEYDQVVRNTLAGEPAKASVALEWAIRAPATTVLWDSHSAVLQGYVERHRDDALRRRTNIVGLEPWALAVLFDETLDEALFATAIEAHGVSWVVDVHRCRIAGTSLRPLMHVCVAKQLEPSLQLGMGRLLANKQPLKVPQDVADIWIDDRGWAYPSRDSAQVIRDATALWSAMCLDVNGDAMRQAAALRSGVSREDEAWGPSLLNALTLVPRTGRRLRKDDREAFDQRMKDLETSGAVRERLLAWADGAPLARRRS